jgi:hypothetical protein
MSHRFETFFFLNYSLGKETQALMKKNHKADFFFKKKEPNNAFFRRHFSPPHCFFTMLLG